MPPEEVATQGGSQIFTIDDFDEGETEASTEEISEETTEETTSTEEPEIEVEGKTATVKTETNELDALRKEISSLKSEIITLSSRPKEEPVKKDETKEKLSRQQIAQILTEHKDNPEVLLNIIDYIAEEKSSEIRDKTVDDINYKSWHSNLSGVANKIISEDEDGYLAANPRVRDSLDDYAKNLGLDNHPAGKLAAYAIMRLSEVVKAKGTDSATTTQSQSSTQTSTRVMDKTRTSSKTDKSLGLKPEELAAAKKFGVKPETYKKFLGRS